MKIFEMRQKLHQLGYVLEQNHQGFTVTNGSVKNLVELHFANLEKIEHWIAEEAQKANRLTEAECELWDEDYKIFVAKQSMKNK